MLPSLRIDARRLRHDVDHVARYGRVHGTGVSRTSFSAADREVRAWLEEQCRDAGLNLRTDGIGNVFVRLEAPDAPAGTAPVWTGSHLDSVPDGGRLDGALGALAALEVVRRLAEEQVPLQRPVEAVVFADEEGNYHHLLGSTAVVQGFALDELSTFRGRDGDLLVDALVGMGWDPHAATRTVVPPGEVHAFVELHIEQGATLESEGVDVGVVTGIVGLGGGRLTFVGRQDHAGTTAMSRRRDPLRGAADLLLQLPDVAASVSPEAVVTCGIITVEPGGSNVVPGAAHLTLDFRDPDRSRLLALEEAIVAAARDAAGRHGVETRYESESITDPVPMDSVVQQHIASVARELGLSSVPIPSGAGHDAQNMARIAPTGMVFVPSIDGRSHSPAEDSSWQDIENGANVLLGAVLRLAT